MTRINREHKTQAQHDQDVIVTLMYERDQAIACLEKIARMHSGKRMKERAKDCLREIELGRFKR